MDGKEASVYVQYVSCGIAGADSTRNLNSVSSYFFSITLLLHFKISYRRMHLKNSRYFYPQITYMNISERLRTLVPFTQDELDDILAHFKEESVSKNQILVRQGEVSKTLYFVEQGMGRSYYLNETGKEITQWFFGVGKFMASADSFFQQCPSLYYLEVLEDSILYGISKGKLDELFATYPKMEKLGRLVTTEMLTKVVNKINAIQFQTARERYDYMLAEFPDIVYQVPLGHIASYLGMTQETLSRIRK